MWDSSHRPEQMFVRNWLADKHPTWKIKTEYRVTNLSIDEKPYKDCTLDIAVLDPKRIAIRLNGGYHFSSGLQETKDEFQEEALIQSGWEVIDLDHHILEHTFSRKWDEKTVKLACEELEEYLGKV